MGILVTPAMLAHRGATSTTFVNATVLPKVDQRPDGLVSPGTAGFSQLGVGMAFLCAGWQIARKMVLFPEHGWARFPPRFLRASSFILIVPG